MKESLRNSTNYKDISGIFDAFKEGIPINIRFDVVRDISDIRDEEFSNIKKWLDDEFFEFEVDNQSGSLVVEISNESDFRLIAERISQYIGKLYNE